MKTFTEYSWNIIYNRQKVELTQMSISWEMGKQKVVYP